MGGSSRPPTPLLLIPGTWLDGRLFAAQGQALSGECAVHVADISRSDSIEELAVDVLADAPPRFALVGFSMGGIVAMEIHRRAPERVTHALEMLEGRERTLSAIACPTLVLCGGEDRLCPPALHVAMAEAIPGADLVVLARSGHLSPLERPNSVTDEIRRLLSRPQQEN